MSGDICYFSSTGNSLVIARQLSEALSCRLVPISADANPSQLNDRDGSGAILGFVFPVYHASYGGSGIPDIVRRFVTGIGDLGGRYVFSVSTNSGTPGETVENFGQLVASLNGRLMVGTAVQMSVPTSPFQKLMHMATGRPLGAIHNEDAKQARLYAAWDESRRRLIGDIEQRRTRLDVPSAFVRSRLRFLSDAQQQAVLKRYQHLAGSDSTDLHELFRLSDTSFKVTGDCKRCGTCAQVCPAANIRMDDGPVWGHRCELCYACYQWCPQQAITGDVVEFEKRHHHPDVSLKDMTRRTAQG